MRGSNYIFVILFMALFGCSKDEGSELPSVEERIDEAISNLTEALISSPNGWRLDYQPTSETGSFLIILNFNENGTARVQSDLTVNNGEFTDHVISYRVDSSQGIELIFETYGVFHYLFELQQASFGGEFEFVYVEEDRDNLIFRSKTDDVSDVTLITLMPASPTDVSSISTQATSILSSGIFQMDNLAGIGSFGNYNFHLKENDYLLSTIFDLGSRKIKILGIAEGSDRISVGASKNIVGINTQTTFKLSDERIILDDPVTATLNGNSVVISDIPITNSSVSSDNFCVDQEYELTSFEGNNESLGSFEARSSLFQVDNSFQSTEDEVYSINPVFIYNDNDNSIVDQIEDSFPEVFAFQLYLEAQIADSTFSGLGFVTVDEFNNAEFFLRGFDFERNGNHFQIIFNGKDLISKENPLQEELDGLNQITNQIFSGGEVYVLELLNINGLYEFYNPCNRYKGFLL